MIVFGGEDAGGQVVAHGEQRAVELDGLRAASGTGGQITLDGVALGNFGGVGRAGDMDPTAVPEASPPLLMGGKRSVQAGGIDGGDETVQVHLPVNRRIGLFGE